MSESQYSFMELPEGGIENLRKAHKPSSCVDTLNRFLAGCRRLHQQLTHLNRDKNAEAAKQFDWPEFKKELSIYFSALAEFEKSNIGNNKYNRYEVLRNLRELISFYYKMIAAETLEYEEFYNKVMTGRIFNDEDSIEERTPSGRRAARRRSEFGDPSRPAFAETNRRDAKFQTRIDPELMDLVEHFIEASGLSKREATERAFRLLIAHEREPS